MVAQWRQLHRPGTLSSLLDHHAQVELRFAGRRLLPGADVAQQQNPIPLLPGVKAEELDDRLACRWIVPSFSASVTTLVAAAEARGTQHT